MASARTDTGVAEYDGTRWRVVPYLTGHPQDPSIHECPVYAEINEERGWAFAMHGPQCPRAVGVEAGQRIAPAGVNPVTGKPRLPFGLHDDGYEYAKPIPYVHGFVLEWLLPGESLHGGPAYGHIEGGVFIHQVAKAQVWYLKTWMALAMSGGRGTYRAHSISVSGKIIFIQRPFIDVAGAPATSSACSSWMDPETRQRLIPGAPSSIKVAYVGHSEYPRFPDVVMKIDDAPFNPTRFTKLTNCLNREGMFAIGHDRCPVLHGMQSPDDAVLSSDYDQHDIGDSLPSADLLAGIQMGHAA